MSEKNFKYSDHPNMITVCAWCFPARTILKNRPELDGGETISHGLCEVCAAKWLADIKKGGSGKAAAV